MEATYRTLGEVHSYKDFIENFENGGDITWFMFLEIAESLGYTVDIEVKGVRSE